MKATIQITRISRILLFVGALFMYNHHVQAQTYKTGVGLLIDVGDGNTLVGPHIKHFFDANSAGEFGLQFGSGLTVLQAMYQYHQPISDAPGLQWYVGLGGLVAFPNNGNKTNFGLTPAAGLDYKLQNVPIALFADWRPKFRFHRGDTEFIAARFGFGLRFILGN